MIINYFIISRYLEKYADPNDEPVSTQYDQSFEDMDLPVEQWKGNCIYFLLFYMNEIDLSCSYLILFTELVFKEVINFMPQQPLSPDAE